jgi:hypothetical protein
VCSGKSWRLRSTKDIRNPVYSSTTSSVHNFTSVTCRSDVVEEQLMHDIQEKRQVGNAAIIEMLKKEFSNPKPTASAAVH